MPSIKSVEALAGVAAESASKILPAKLVEVAESLASKAGLTAENKGARGVDTAGASSTDMLGLLTITDGAAGGRLLNPAAADIARANEALVGHITQLVPQVHKGKLDWILGGSSAVNALSSARNLTILDATRLPAIVPSKTIELSEGATAGFGKFVRRISDVDAFVVNGGENRFLQSPYLGAIEAQLPESAYGALTHVGEARTSSLFQGVKMEFEHPEIAAIEYAGKTVYVTGPGQLVGNKLRQVLLQYAPADARKTTGDFSQILEAASAIYPEQALLQFGRQGVQRNNILYTRDINLPWDKTPENTKFLDFLRKVLESEERNGAYLKGLKIDPTDSITAIRLFEKHPVPAEKSAIAGFINRHADYVTKLDVKGSPERAMYLSQGGSGKARDTFMNMLERLPSGGGTGGTSPLMQRLNELEVQLSQNANLPALAKLVSAK